MQRLTLLAAILMVGTCAIHAFVGGPEVHGPIQASDLPPLLRAVSAVVWHGVTVILAAFALALFWMARHPNKPMAVLIIGVLLGFAALFFTYGLSAMGNVWDMPQWIIFLVQPPLIAAAQLRR